MENKTKQLDTNTFTLMGDKILVKLEQYPDQTKDSKVINLAYTNTETDGGRPDSKIDVKLWKHVGEVVAIAKKGQQTLDENLMDVKVGDRITLNKSAIHVNSWFFLDPAGPVENTNGYVSVHPSHILSKFN